MFTLLVIAIYLEGEMRFMKTVVVNKTWWTRHLVYPLLALVALSLIINFLDLDKIIADSLYGLEGDAWTLRQHWFVEGVLHKGGRALSIILFLICLCGFGVSFFKDALRPYRLSLGYLLLTVAVSTLLVGFLKKHSGVSCPWEFSIYGGSLDYLPVFKQLTVHNGSGCFPAGHVSAAYAWLGLFYVMLSYKPHWRFPALLLVIVCGLSFGIAQQLRGAHFISHDLWTLAICWFIATGFYPIILAPKNSTVQSTYRLARNTAL